MDINDLNKSQLILLALLLSFVTSIATGIVTVTLMDQSIDNSNPAPINRIIRQTVERIVAVENTEPSEIDQKKKSEEERLSENLKLISPLIVTLYTNNEGKDILLSSGILVGEKRAIFPTNFPLEEVKDYKVRGVLGEKNASISSVNKDFVILDLNDKIIEPPKEEPKTE